MSKRAQLLARNSVPIGEERSQWYLVAGICYITVTISASTSIPSIGTGTI